MSIISPSGGGTDLQQQIPYDFDVQDNFFVYFTLKQVRGN